MERASTRRVVWLTILASLWLVTAVQAQNSEPELDLSLNRDFGYSSGGGQIQGTFSLKVKGPSDLERVLFLLDGETLMEDNLAPFTYQFSTDVHPNGVHTLSAIGYTKEDLTLSSRLIRLEFVSAEEGGRAAMRIALPIVGLVFGLMALSYALPVLLGRARPVPLGMPRNYGLAGGTICPKCTRPFPLFVLGTNLILGRLERCPHCGKWSLVKRYPNEMLRAAEAAELADSKKAENLVNGASEEDNLKKALDDSRFQDV